MSSVNPPRKQDAANIAQACEQHATFEYPLSSARPPQFGVREASQPYLARPNTLTASDHESTASDLEHIARHAFMQARQQALDAGLAVTEVAEGYLVETTADGRQTRLDILPAAIGVPVGSRKPLPC